MKSTLEVLESRIAPAAVFTYTEADGDKITITTSARISDADFAAYIALNSAFANDDLQHLILNDPVFQNSNLTISVSEVVGDGKASIGQIHSVLDLKNVVIDGNLGGIVVGDTNFATPALNKLQVEDLGALGVTALRGNVNTVKISGDLVGSLTSYDAMQGGVKSIQVAGSISETGYIFLPKVGTLTVGKDVFGQVTSPTIKSIRIAGNIDGTTGIGLGSINVSSLKSLKVGGDIIGGEALGSGAVISQILGTAIIEGDIKGGAGPDAGSISASYADKIIVRGNLIGGEGISSGSIKMTTGLLPQAKAGLIRVEKDLVSGTGVFSGSVSFFAPGVAEKIVVGGSLLGYQNALDQNDDPIVLSGMYGGSIHSSIGEIQSLRILGNVEGGPAELSGSVFASYLTSAYVGGSVLGGDGPQSGSVNAFNGIGNIRVAGSLEGGNGMGSASILALGGIGSVKVGGDVKGLAFQSGSIASDGGSIGSIAIGGALSNEATFGASVNGIFAAGTIERVSIGGGVNGGDYGTLTIRAGWIGIPSQYASSIGSISIKGDVEDLAIEAGHSIDSVRITGDFIRSSISAGVQPGFDQFYGTEDDIPPLPFSANLATRIASVVIGGTASGTAEALEGYGIFAQNIGALTVNGVKQALTKGAGNDLVEALLSGTTNVRYKEYPVITLP